MTCAGPDRLLEWLDDAPQGADAAHLAGCAACATALDDMRRVRRLARALAPARATAPSSARSVARRRHHRLQSVLTTAAALALFVALGAEPALRSRIDRGAGGANQPVAYVGSHASVFWTSGLARVGDH